MIILATNNKGKVKEIKMKFMKLVALATAVSCCLTGCSFTGDGILGQR